MVKFISLYTGKFVESTLVSIKDIYKMHSSNVIFLLNCCSIVSLVSSTVRNWQIPLAPLVTCFGLDSLKSFLVFCLHTMCDISKGWLLKITTLTLELSVSMKYVG